MCYNLPDMYINIAASGSGSLGKMLILSHNISLELVQLTHALRNCTARQLLVV